MYSNWPLFTSIAWFWPLHMPFRPPPTPRLSHSLHWIFKSNTIIPSYVKDHRYTNEKDWILCNYGTNSFNLQPLTCLDSEHHCNDFTDNRTMYKNSTSRWLFSNKLSYIPYTYLNTILPQWNLSFLPSLSFITFTLKRLETLPAIYQNIHIKESWGWWQPQV